MIKPVDLSLPDKFTEFRGGQLETSARIAGSGKYAFLLDAPTGIGKSLIAATVQRLLAKNVVYLTSTKQLQDQILHDFPYARTMKGRSNYPCAKYPRMFPEISAEECTDSKSNPCEVKDQCKYIRAKNMALHSPLAVLNICLLYTSPSPRDLSTSRMPSSA